MTTNGRQSNLGRKYLYKIGLGIILCAIIFSLPSLSCGHSDNPSFKYSREANENFDPKKVLAPELDHRHHDHHHPHSHGDHDHDHDDDHYHTGNHKHEYHQHKAKVPLGKNFSYVKLYIKRITF